MRLLALITSLAFVLASCRSQYEPQTALVDPGPPRRVLPTIRVLDPGMTPRAPMRYRVTPGQTEVLYVELVMLRATEAGGQEQGGGIPPIQLQVKMGPAQPAPDGLLRHPVKITQVRVSKVADQMSAAAREELDALLEPLLSVEGWSEMDAQGRIRRSEFTGLDNVPPRLASMLGNIRTALLSIPFPDEPIGVRARWAVDRKIQFSGIWVDQTVTYDLMEMDGKTLKLQIQANQSAPPQQFGNGRLDGYQASVIGSSVVRLGFFTPHSEAESSSQMRIETGGGGQQQLVRVETRSGVRVYPATEAASFDAPAGGADLPGTEDEEPSQDPNKVVDPAKQELRWIQ